MKKTPEPFSFSCSSPGAFMAGLLALALLPDTPLHGEVINGNVPVVMDTASETYLFNAGYVGALGGTSGANPGNPVIGDTHGGITLRVEGAASLTLDTADLSGDGLGGTNWKRISLGYSAASDGNQLRVSGTGTTLNATAVSMFSVGGYGSGNSFVVENGAVAQMGRVATSYFAGSQNNSIAITGDGSKITTTSPSLFGYYGSGSTLTISDGGSYEGGNRVYIGFRGSENDPNYQSGSPGGGGHSAIVSGTGSLLSAYGSSGFLYVGNAGDNNTLLVENGGTVRSVGAYIGTGGGFNDGVQTGGHNTATITGAGSLWDITNYYNTGTGVVSNRDFFVGKAGSANLLQVLDGGRVYNPNNLHTSGNGLLSDQQPHAEDPGNPGSISTANNRVVVSGAGSVLENEGDINIGTLLLESVTVDGNGNITGQTSLLGPGGEYQYSTGSLTITDRALVMIGSEFKEESVLSLAVGSSVLINGGYLAWYGDFADSFYASSALGGLIDDGYFSIFTPGGIWETATRDDFTIQYVSDDLASSELTGGLYDYLAGYTVLTSAYVIPEPSSGLLLLAALGYTVISRRFRSINFGRMPTAASIRVRLP